MSNSEAGSPQIRPWVVPASLALLLALVVWTVAYLMAATPGPLMGGAPTEIFRIENMAVTKGAGRLESPFIVVEATDASGLAIVSVEIPVAINAADYRRVRWVLSGAHSEVPLAMLWRTDEAGTKINSIPLEVVSGGAEVVLSSATPGWSGRVRGIALTMHGKLRQPIVLESVVIDSLSGGEVIADRLRDWFGFQPWSGLSINAAVGGPLDQPLWLTLAVAVVGITAFVLWWLWRRRYPFGMREQIPLVVCTLFALSWLALDSRWLWLRLQQTKLTTSQFAGKTDSEKHLNDVDAEVFDFAQRVRAALPATPARVYVTANEHYFRARLAYHLYAHNVWLDHRGGTLPGAALCRPGEFIVVFRRNGVQYDPARQLLRWDDQPPLKAELLMAEAGKAAFRLL